MGKGFAKWVRENRRLCGLSMEQLAELAGVSNTTIKQIENNRREARPKTAEAVRGAVLSAVERKRGEEREWARLAREAGRAGVRAATQPVAPEKPVEDVAEEPAEAPVEPSEDEAALDLFVEGLVDGTDVSEVDLALTVKWVLANLHVRRAEKLRDCPNSVAYSLWDWGREARASAIQHLFKYLPKEEAGEDERSDRALKQDADLGGLLEELDGFRKCPKCGEAL